MYKILTLERKCILLNKTICISLMFGNKINTFRLLKSPIRKWHGIALGVFLKRINYELLDICLHKNLVKKNVPGSLITPERYYCCIFGVSEEIKIYVEQLGVWQKFKFSLIFFENVTKVSNVNLKFYLQRWVMAHIKQLQMNPSTNILIFYLRAV